MTKHDCEDFSFFFFVFSRLMIKQKNDPRVKRRNSGSTIQLHQQQQVVEPLPTSQLTY